MSKAAYDEHYKQKEYFGEPYEGLIDFFKSYESKGRVLDLGCGQGRDSIPIAQMGYDVIAVDHSEVGIEQLAKTALSAGVSIKTLVGDVYQMNIDQSIDIVLLDSMLHFYKNDVEKESAFVKRILNELRIGGVFANFIIKGKVREKTLKDIIDQSEFEWEVLTEKYVNYPESASQYHMLVIRKVKAK